MTEELTNYEKYFPVWTTEHEIEFLTKIGKFGANGGSFMPYHELLKGYKKGMALRSNWGEINKRKIKEYVDFLLDK